MTAAALTVATNGLFDLKLSEFQEDCQTAQISETSLDQSTESLPVTPPDCPEDAQLGLSKKKKKKKPKKSTKNKANGSDAHEGGASSNGRDVRPPPVLCISRNKHWKYISTYHGPWLQLPLELLESLLILNLDPATIALAEPRYPPLPSPQSSSSSPVNRLREHNFSSYSPPESPQSMYSPEPMPPLFPPPVPGKATPPPIDPGVFRSVALIRKLIDEAAELSVRASSGLSAAALGSMRNSSSLNLSGSPWSAVQSLGLNPMGDFGGSGGGRNFSMSANRVHRLRLLAVQKLAEAYKMDEIASSVMVMQGGTVFDDIAEKVLKVEPNNVDARYVHFFHEKIPSRQLAESTPTTALDQLIAENPQHLEFYRTRGIVHCFRDEYALAVKDFTYALRESRVVRRVRQAHDPAFRSNADNNPKTRRKKAKVNGQAPASGTAPVIEGPDGEQLLIHRSVLSDAPDPLEPQVLFHRGAAHLAHAFFLIEEEIYKLEGIQKAPPSDIGEMRLSYIENGKYGGTEIGNAEGPLGRSDGAKAQAYRAALVEAKLYEQVCSLLKKSKRDHERFLAHFDTLEAVPDDMLDEDIMQKTERAFQLLEMYRPTTRTSDPPPLPDVPLAFTTYHPLMVESHFSILICLLLLGEFQALVMTFERSAGLVAGLESYPVFLPPRSMGQAEFLEVLERLAGDWKYAKFSSALVRTHLNVTPRFTAPLMRRTPSPLIITITTPVNDGAGASASASAGPSTASGARTPSGSGRGSPTSEDTDLGGAAAQARAFDLREALESLRVLLAPVLTRQRERAALARAAGASAEKRPLPISIPLHGARVDVVLAWLGAVHLPELESVA